MPTPDPDQAEKRRAANIRRIDLSTALASLDRRGTQEHGEGARGTEAATYPEGGDGSSRRAPSP